MTVRYNGYREVFSGQAAAGGGTFVLDVAVPADKGSFLTAIVKLGALTAGHFTDGGVLYAEADFSNNAGAGTVGLTPALVGSVNPSNSATLLAAAAEAASNVFRAGGVGVGAPPTAVWSAPGAVARLTVTNPGTVNALVTVFLERYDAGGV